MISCEVSSKCDRAIKSLSRDVVGLGSARRGHGMIRCESYADILYDKRMLENEY